jgi:hypothetical protein
MPLSITYQITGLGWAECTLKTGAGSCTVTACYLSDALGSLVTAAKALLSSFTAVTFSFDEEPGEYRWVIRSPRLNELQIKILSFSELWSGEPDEEGKEVFHFVCTPETFAEAVHAAASAVLAEHGEAGYLEKWHEHPFPLGAFTELSRGLSALKGDA